jgi:hypothetical protein
MTMYLASACLMLLATIALAQSATYPYSSVGFSSPYFCSRR